MFLSSHKGAINQTIVIALMALGVFACQGASAPRSWSDLRIGAALPSERAANSSLSVLVDSLTTDPLLTTNLDGRQTARLAESWWWDPSHTVLTVELRHDVQFHDGTKLNADLATASIRADVAAHSFRSFDTITDVRVTGPYSFEVRLKQPDNFVLGDLATASVRIPGKKDIGTGPYRITTRTPVISLDAFDGYYRGRPNIRRVTVESYPTQRSAWAAMMRGDIDVLHEVSRDSVDFLRAETAVRTFSFPRAYYIPLVFNVRNPVLKNAEVRRAIGEALDKAALVRDGLHGQGRPAEGPVWPEYWAYSAPQHPIAYNPEAARLRLDAAGFPVKPGVNGAMPKRFTLNCVVYNEDARYERLALLIQKQLFDIGIDMRLIPVNQADLAQRVSKGDFDTFLIEMASGKALNWVYLFWHSPSGRAAIDTGYEAADGALERIRRSISDQGTKLAVADLNNIFQQDPPAVFLAWLSESRAVSDRFAVPPDPGRDILATLWQWQPSDNRVAQK